MSREMLELDHIFIMCDVDAPEAMALTTAGLVEGLPNVHPGQGTACRRFAFPRQYLELVWVADATEAQNHRTRRTRLWERWSLRRREACPFGLVFRIAGGTTTAPFPTWSYTPRYLPVGVSLEMADDTPICEPEFCILPPGSRRVDRPQQPAVPGIAITHLHLGTPRGVLKASASRWAASAGVISASREEEYVLTVTFDHADAQRSVDLRPILPLVLAW